jgi:MoaA/NifB/PqqE/SkfB family radical SAM enzyme
MNKPLCYAPFIGLYATGYEQYAPCCVAKKETYKNVTPGEYWSSEEMQEIRRTLLNQKWPDKCEFCKLKQQNNLKNETWIWEKHNKKVNIDLSIEYGNTSKGPLFLDYRPSNICNLKCRMCVPNASSQITKEFQIHSEMQKWFTAPNKEVKNFNSFKDYISNIELRQIKILGGEPTVDPLVLDFLEEIVSKYDNLPSLRFTTNGTNLNKRFKKVIEKFNDVHIVFSIDAIEDTYEYIRTNASWIKTKKIIEEIFDNNMAKIYGFNIVIMPYNIFNIVELLEWFENLERKGYVFETFYDLSEGYTTDMRSVLPEDLEYAKEKIIKWSKDNNKDVSSILSLIKTITFDEYYFNCFKQYNNSLDKIRKTNLITLNERFQKYV